MKFCAVVAEYNPFHSGHKYLLERAKALSGADKLLVVMSGNFTQRGEVAVMDKFTRAKHAVQGGADLVLELPALFATAPAEFFAGGAVKLIASLPSVTSLAFGAENDDLPALEKTAALLSDEPKSFKKSLKEKLKSGVSLLKAREETLNEWDEADASFLREPNNILALEYAKAKNKFSASFSLLPVKRVGDGYKEESILSAYPSASALRKAAFSPDKKTLKLLKTLLPEEELSDLLSAKQTSFEELAVYSLFLRTPSELKKILGCTEGLENRLLALLKDTRDYHSLLEKMTSKRYTASRLKRILLSSFLSFSASDVFDALEGDLYYKVLAVKKEGAEELLAALNEGTFSPVVRKKDADELKRSAARCFEKDVHANDLYNYLTGSRLNEYFTLFVPTSE